MNKRFLRDETEWVAYQIGLEAPCADLWEHLGKPESFPCYVTTTHTRTGSFNTCDRHLLTHSFSYPARVVVVAEGEAHGVFIFATPEECNAFRAGVAHGSHLYGAEECYTVTDDELEKLANGSADEQRLAAVARKELEDAR